MRSNPRKHDCRDHLVISHGVNGGKASFHCGKCGCTPRLRFGPRDVLARVEPKRVSA